MEFLELEVVCLSNYLWLCVDKFSSFHLSFIFLKILVYICKFLVEVVHSSDYLCICDCIYTGWLLCPPCSGGRWHLPWRQVISHPIAPQSSVNFITVCEKDSCSIFSSLQHAFSCQGFLLCPMSTSVLLDLCLMFTFVLFDLCLMFHKPCLTWLFFLSYTE